MEFNRHRQNLITRAVQFPVSELNFKGSEARDELSPPDGGYFVDIDQLQKLCSKGIPDLPGVRPTCWKLLLRYLPNDKRQWLAHLKQHRNSYYEFVRDLVDGLGHQFPLAEKARKRGLATEPGDGKLDDLKLMEQIDMDVRRTLSDHLHAHLGANQLPFYATDGEAIFEAFPKPDPFDSEYGKAPDLSLGDSRLAGSFYLGPEAELTTGERNYLEMLWCEKVAPPEDEEASAETSTDFHWEALERILFIYAKLNPGVGYVQGMNEILAPIYYVCAHDVDGPLEGRIYAEADAFFLFTAVMGSVRDQYVKQLDHDARVGVNATLAALEAKLAQAAPDLARDMRGKGLETAFFAFRWITVLGAQEFDLPDVIRLWDALLSHTPLYHGSENGLPVTSPGVTSPLNTMIMVGVAMLCLVRPLLLEGTFTENLQLLQNYPPLYDISTIVELAYQLEAMPPNTGLDFKLFISESSEAAAPLLTTTDRSLLYTLGEPTAPPANPWTLPAPPNPPVTHPPTPPTGTQSASTWLRAQAARWF
ncbi:hypothetical protein L0F63_006253 [Massospora cicadina]|nr:hypothetical protein L0F63_006253 [Massospora cicadina]